MRLNEMVDNTENEPPQLRCEARFGNVGFRIARSEREVDTEIDFGVRVERNSLFGKFS